MNTKEFYSEEPVTIAEVKKILTASSKEKELEYVQKKALEHSQHCAKVSFTDANKMVAELEALEVNKEKAIEIVNAMPNDRDEIRAFFSKERKPPETDTIDAVLGVLAKYK